MGSNWRRPLLPGESAPVTKAMERKRAAGQSQRQRDSVPMATYREYRGSARFTLSLPGVLARQLLGARIVR